MTLYQLKLYGDTSGNMCFGSNSKATKYKPQRAHGEGDHCEMLEYTAVASTS